MSGQGPIPDALDREVTFLSGFERDGTLGATTFATWNGDTPATYSTTSQQFKWGRGRAGTPGGTVTYAFAPGAKFTAAERKVFRAGLALWSDEADIQFAAAGSGAAADVTFRRNHFGDASEDDSEPGHAVGTRRVSNPSGAVISIDSRSQFFGPIDTPFAFGAFPLSTIVHEEGHLLGLGHTGPYNGGTVKKTDPLQFGIYDQQLYSVMSYIAPGDKAAPYYGQYPVDARFPNAETPMIADILAAQRIYGAPTETALSGGQVFGFHCNISDATKLFFDFTVDKKPVVTLFDTGGDNTLDLSGYSSNAVVDLRQGHFSSCAGLTDNIAIALGTAIHRVVCGAGDDTIHGTLGNDAIVGGAGNDVMTGGGGHDTFVFRPHSGQDQITDFGVCGPDESKLRFVDSTFQCIAAVLRHTSMSDGSATIHLDAQDGVTLFGVTKAELQAHRGDIVLV